MTELTYEEFCAQPMTLCIRLVLDDGTQMLYRNEELKVQREVFTKRKVKGDIYSGWKPSKSYFFLDKDPNMYHNPAELYEAYMRKVCGVKESA